MAEQVIKDVRDVLQVGLFILRILSLNICSSILISFLILHNSAFTFLYLHSRLLFSHLINQGLLCCTEGEDDYLHFSHSKLHISILRLDESVKFGDNVGWCAIHSQTTGEQPHEVDWQVLLIAQVLIIVFHQYNQTLESLIA